MDVEAEVAALAHATYDAAHTGRLSENPQDQEMYLELARNMRRHLNTLGWGLHPTGNGHRAGRDFDLRIDLGDEVYALSRKGGVWSGTYSSAYEENEIIDHDRCLSIIKFTLLVAGRERGEGEAG